MDAAQVRNRRQGYAVSGANRNPGTFALETIDGAGDRSPDRQTRSPNILEYNVTRTTRLYAEPGRFDIRDLCDNRSNSSATTHCVPQFREGLLKKRQAGAPV